MGRSQVLYNRTKGRYRQRNGAQGRGSSTTPQHVASESPHENLPPPQPSLNTAKSRRPKIDESILLAEPTTMYVTHHEGVDDDIVFASGGMIDIANLAATLTTSMSLAQQLRIPSHVAYQLQTPNVTLELKTVKSKNDMSVETSNDDASFSVAHTRLRVDADGQVEARPKPGLYNPLVLVESIKEDEYIEDSSRHNNNIHQRHEENQESVPTFDDSLEPESRLIRHGNDFDEGDEDEDEDEDDESHGPDRYMALVDSTLDDSDEFYGVTSLDQSRPPTGTVATNRTTFQAGYPPASSRPEVTAPYSVPQVQSPRGAPPSSIDRVAKRQPKIDTSIGNTKRTAVAQPSAPTPKHSNNNPGSTARSNQPKETESFLEGWLEEALKSEEPPLPISQISVRPVGDNHDDYSSITDLPHHGGSSISSITFSKVGTRTDKASYYTRNRLYNDDDRRFSALGGIISSGSSGGGGSTMDSRGQIYEDDGSAQPLTRKHQPSPHAKSKPSSSKSKVDASGEDLDAWLDSVIA